MELIEQDRRLIAKAGTSGWVSPGPGPSHEIDLVTLSASGFAR